MLKVKSIFKPYDLRLFYFNNIILVQHLQGPHDILSPAFCSLSLEFLLPMKFDDKDKVYTLYFLDSFREQCVDKLINAYCHPKCL